MRRKILAVAAVIALMVCSSAIGAAAFGAQPPETIELEAIGLTLVLPDTWKGKYGVEMNEDGTGCAVYVKSIHDGSGDWAGQGYLFWIGAVYDEPMTPEELYARSAVPCIYLFSTSTRTYALDKHSDVQYDPSDSEQAALYMAMSRQIQEIAFLVDNPAAVH